MEAYQAGRDPATRAYAGVVLTVNVAERPTSSLACRRGAVDQHVCEEGRERRQLLEICHPGPWRIPFDEELVKSRPSRAGR